MTIRPEDIDRDPLEQLAEEFTERCRRGEDPSIDEYAARIPELGDDIRELFPMIREVELAKSATAGLSGPLFDWVDDPAQRLGDFRILREIGRGGMGIVYEAEQQSLSRRVAVKVLPRRFMSDPARQERFAREAKTAARLHHTNIVPIFGVGEHDGHQYFVMQYIRGVGLDAVFRLLFQERHEDGGSASVSPSRMPARFDFAGVAGSLLEDTSGGSLATDGERSLDVHSADAPAAKVDGDLRQQPALTTAYWRGLAALMAQAADALAHAHGQGVIHRDIKPSNLLLDAEGTLWITDFGLAKAVEHDDMTQAEDIIGTLRYMAPEQHNRQGDERSDVYGLGVTLYELATLRPAFADVKGSSYLRAVLEEPLWPPRRFCPTMPRDLETIILKATAREPNDRYLSAAELRDDLLRFVEDRPILARRFSPAERLWRWARRNPALAATTGVVLALLMSIAVISSAAYFNVSSANQREKHHRERAEATADLAVEALDTIFEQLAPQRTGVTSSLTLEDSEGDEISVPIQPVLSRESAAVLEEMLEFYRRLAAQEGHDPVIRRKTADASRRVGDIHQRLGHFEDARTAYGRAIQLYEQLDEQRGGRPAITLEIARIHNELGSILISEEDPQSGQAAFARARAILEPMNSLPEPAPAARYELARTYFLLGRALQSPVPVRPGPRPGPGPGSGPPADGLPPPHHRPLGGPEHERPPPPPPHHALSKSPGERAELRKDAIQILADLSRDHPDIPDYRHLLALCYRDMPAGPLAKADFSRVDAVDRAIEILQSLVADFPTDPEYRHDLSRTYAMSAGPGLRGGPGSDTRAMEEERLRTALAIAEELVAEHPNVPYYAVSKVHIHFRLADCLRRRGEPDAAEDSLLEARALQSSLVQRFAEMTSHHVWMAMIEGALGRLARDRGELEEARSHLETSLAVLSELTPEQRRPPYVMDVLLQTHMDLARVHRRLGDDGAAAEAIRRAEQLRPLR